MNNSACAAYLAGQPLGLDGRGGWLTPQRHRQRVTGRLCPAKQESAGSRPGRPAWTASRPGSVSADLVQGIKPSAAGELVQLVMVR